MLMSALIRRKNQRQRNDLIERDKTMSDKIKIYKNPARNEPEKHKPYIHQYREKDIEPEEYFGSKNTANIVISKNTPQLPLDNPRVRRPLISQPYAEAVSSPIGYGPVPNVGNNMEHTWSSIDGEIIDDISEQVNQKSTMIDNNDYIDPSVYGNLEQQFLPPVKMEEQPQELFSVIKELEVDEYLLLINNSAVCSCPLKEMEEQVRLLVFGEHELCN